jgi:hypothetical protein
MNQAFEQLCEKYELSEEIQTDFKNLFESEIIKVFYKMSMKEDVKDVKDVKKTAVKSTATKTKSKSSDSEICAGKKANGEDCTFKAKENGYCGRHDPDKSSTSKSSSAKEKPKTKKSAHECNAIIPKTKKPCSQPGTVKPEDAEFYYCKRHSENWTNFEQEPETKLVDSEAEADEEAEA